MCFSPAADLVGGLVVGAIGLDVALHLRGRRKYLPLALLPLMFAAHQLVESLVWWATAGQVPHWLGTVALWVYLLFAFVVLPTYVPWAVRRIEPPGRRRMLMTGVTLVGVAVSATLLAAMIRGPVSVEAHEHHLAYGTSLRASLLISGAYVLVTCGAFVFSGEAVIVWFGWVNLIGVAVIAALTIDGFASVWCAWAALTSAAFAAYLRREDPRLFTHAVGARADS